MDLEDEMMEVRQDVSISEANNPTAEINDKDYIFMSYVMDYLPHGIIGLLAVMFSAAMSSTASELNALASTTTGFVQKIYGQK